MEAKNDKIKIVKQTFPSELISIIGDIFAGIILSILITPYDSFILLILIIPALLSLRGNLSGPFIARTSRDFIIGEFNKKSWFENVLATLSLSLLTALAIGVFSILINFLLIKLYIFNIGLLIVIPIVSIALTLSISIPCSTLLNFVAFKRGLDPNSIVNPVMTAIDDLFTVICFYLTIIMLGVP
ncbi:MAG: magnesium transporter [Candidatus Hermodarchaeota archaeon]